MPTIRRHTIGVTPSGPKTEMDMRGLAERKEELKRLLEQCQRESDFFLERAEEDVTARTRVSNLRRAWEISPIR